MSRYYLHLRDFAGSLTEDEDGSELAGLAAAKQHAMLAIQELLGDAIKQGNELQFEAIVVADKDGTQVATVPLVAALPSAIVNLLKCPDKMVPASKFEEYRRNADHCRAKAEGTADLDDKMSWLKLANAWLQMLPPTHSASAELAGWPKAAEGDSKASH